MCPRVNGDVLCELDLEGTEVRAIKEDEGGTADANSEDRLSGPRKLLHNSPDISEFVSSISQLSFYAR